MRFQLQEEGRLKLARLRSQIGLISRVGRPNTETKEEEEMNITSITKA